MKVPILAEFPKREDSQGKLYYILHAARCQCKWKSQSIVIPQKIGNPRLTDVVLQLLLISQLHVVSHFKNYIV